MKAIMKYILKIILSELLAILIFGGAYLIASFLLPNDDISTKIKWGILFLYGISAISLPFIIKYFSR